MKKLRKRLVLALASLLALALLGEGVVRLYEALFHPKMMRLDDRLGWRHGADRRKHFTNEDGEEILVVANAHGHRGTDHGLARNAGRARVLVLGDSFTEGVHVAEDELFTARLEAGLANVEVLNAGVGGYGTVQELLYFRDEGVSFRPDLVLLMVYENDLTDNVLSYYPTIGPRPWASLDGRGAVVIHETLREDEYLDFCPGVPFAGFLARHSLLFYVFQERIWHELWREEFQALHAERMNATPLDDQLAVFSGVLARLRRRCAEASVDLAVALIPSRHQVKEGRAPVLDRLAAACRVLDVPVHPLLSALRTAHEAGERPYFRRDIHWTATGHRVVAQVLTPIVAARLEARER